MRGIGRLPISPVRQAIRSRETKHLVFRQVVETGDMGQDVTKERELPEPVSMYLYAPHESQVQVPGGEQMRGSLLGLIVNDHEDPEQPRIQVGDIVGYAGNEYVLDRMVGNNEDEEPEIYQLSFTRAEFDQLE